MSHETLSETTRVPETVIVQDVVSILQSDFKEWELPRLFLAELKTDSPVSKNVLCEIARKHLPPQVDFDVTPLVRQAVSMLCAAAALHFADGKNPLGYMPDWSPDDDYVAWKQDKQYLLELGRHAGLANLF